MPAGNWTVELWESGRPTPSRVHSYVFTRTSTVYNRWDWIVTGKWYQLRIRNSLTTETRVGSRVYLFTGTRSVTLPFLDWNWAANG